MGPHISYYYVKNNHSDCDSDGDKNVLAKILQIIAQISPSRLSYQSVDDGLN